MFRIDYRLKGWRVEETRTLNDCDMYMTRIQKPKRGDKSSREKVSVIFYAVRSTGEGYEIERIEDVNDITYFMVTPRD